MSKLSPWHRLMRLPITALYGIVLLGIAMPSASAQDDTAVGEIALEAAEAAQETTANDLATRYPQVQAAFDLFRSREFQEAEEMLKQATANNPELPPAGIIVGTWYFNAKAPELARAAFERAVRDNPTDPEAYVVFGENALQQRRFTDAILLFQEGINVLNSYSASAVRKKNLTVRAERGRAGVLEAREEWEEAENAYRRVIKADSENLLAMARLARVLYKQGSSENHSEAYEIFKKMYQLDPDKSGRYEIAMARLYQQDGEDDRAEKLVTVALQKDPNTLNTQLAAATWAMEAGKMDIAQKAATAALGIDRQNVKVRLLEGVLKRVEGDLEAAEAALRAASALSPSNVAVLNQLAITLASQEPDSKREQAVEFAQMATRLFPDVRNAAGRESAVTLAWVLHRLGKGEAAKKALIKALQGGGVTGDPAYMAAEIFHATGQSDTSVRLLESALENARGLFPMRPDAEQLLQKIKGL